MHLKSKTIHGFFPTHCSKSLVVFKYFSSPNIVWLLMLLILFLILLFNAWPSTSNTSPPPSKILFLLQISNLYAPQTEFTVAKSTYLGSPTGSEAIPAIPSSYQYLVPPHFHVTVRRGAGSIFSNTQAWEFTQQPEIAAINCSALSYTCINTLAHIDYYSFAGNTSCCARSVKTFPC